MLVAGHNGRLGLAKARIPQADRHGVLGLDRGRLEVVSGCLRFVTAGGLLEAGEYDIPYQALSILLIGPGSSVTHDALRLLGRHGVALAAIGEDGVRLYTAPPLGTRTSALGRRQATLWARPQSRLAVARRMYAIRFGEVLPAREIEMLRGLEGVRVKESYTRTAQEFGIEWRGRRYDRSNPAAADIPNQAINHAASAVVAAAAVAVAATATIPQLGFVHEEAGEAFVLDIADLFRDCVTLRIAFGAAAEHQAGAGVAIERLVRRRATETFRSDRVIAGMIDRIKQLLAEKEEAPWA